MTSKTFLKTVTDHFVGVSPFESIAINTVKIPIKMCLFKLDISISIHCIHPCWTSTAVVESGRATALFVRQTRIHPENQSSDKNVCKV